MNAESNAQHTPPSSQKPPPCTHCGRAILAPYFVANEAVVCTTCRPEVVEQLTGGSSTSRFLRALGFGVLAAGVGATIYFAILALSGYEIGLVAIIVGLIVGKAVHAGSRGRGGLGYQALAVALTYSAIVVTYIPFILGAAADEWPMEGHADAVESAVVADGSVKTTKAAAAEEPLIKLEGEAIGPAELILALGVLFAFAAAAPVLAGVENVVGLLIIGFALHQAWTLNKRTDHYIKGPFPISGGNAA